MNQKDNGDVVSGAAQVTPDHLTRTAGIVIRLIV